MTTRPVNRLLSLVLAAGMSLAMLAGVDNLARVHPAASADLLAAKTTSVRA